MNVAVQLQPLAGAAPAVQYRWDRDTDILIARLEELPAGTGMNGSVELEGTDGSWLVLDVSSGRISGVEVAVWPNVQKRTSLAPPTSIEEATVIIPARASQPGIASLEVETPLLAEADEARRVIHFRVGARRDVRTVRLGRDLLIEIDSQRRIAGLWMLNVPPSPSS